MSQLKRQLMLVSTMGHDPAVGSSKADHCNRQLMADIRHHGLRQSHWMGSCRPGQAARALRSGQTLRQTAASIHPSNATQQTRNQAS